MKGLKIADPIPVKSNIEIKRIYRICDVHKPEICIDFEMEIRAEYGIRWKIFLCGIMEARITGIVAFVVLIRPEEYRTVSSGNCFG